jgi:hypothetical protein
MRVINTHYWAKPIPIRGYDWSATYDDYDGAEDSANRHMVGFGATEIDAIQDLERLHNEMMECAEDDELRNQDRI